MLAVLWAYLIYNEALGTTQWIGIALVLTGLLLFSLRNTPAASDEARQKPSDSSHELG